MTAKEPLHNTHIVCNSDNPYLRDIYTKWEVVTAAIKRPCPKHGYIHSLSNPYYQVIEASKDLTVWPDMPIRRARDYPSVHCSHPSCYYLKGDNTKMVCYKCHDVILRTTDEPGTEDNTRFEEDRRDIEATLADTREMQCECEYEAGNSTERERGFA